MRKPPEHIEIEPDAWCAWCGETLAEEADRDPRQFYCNAKCRKAMWHDMHKGDPLPKSPGTCQECGAEFLTHMPTRLFCSRRCRRLVNARAERARKPKRPLTPRPCAGCGQTFQTRRTDKLYCSEPCRRRNRRRTGAKSASRALMLWVTT